ncbi:MAG TPA: hypothetical protein VLV88_08590 [Terriglobales bacterium]|nr:hypothetical protein [Terriglobales bacterium]
MKSRGAALVLAAIVVVVGASAYSHWRWGKASRDPRSELLSALPFTSDTKAVVYLDVASLGHSVFLKQLITWAAKPAEDPDYTQFVRNTGFDYERDLDATAIAIMGDGETSGIYAIAKGRFDEKKITAYALRTGNSQKENARTVYCVPVSGKTGQICFAFEGDERIVLTNEANLAGSLARTSDATDPAEWRLRFERLAGSPAFAVIRRDASAASAFAGAAPGGFQSPQLATLLSQLSWITIAGKPDGPQMEIVAEGETSDSSLALQLSDFLNGIVLMAETGLNDPKVQAHLDAGTEDAYQQLLKSADISRIDRGLTKSVRVVVTITPQLLKSSQTTPAETAPPAAQDARHSLKNEKESGSRKALQRH